MNRLRWVFFLRKLVRLIGVFVLSILSVAGGQTATVILPASAATVDAGAAGGSGVLTVALRQQIVVGAVNMPNVPVWIYELRFRPSAVFGKAFSGVIPDIQFNLSTTASDPELLQSTFADNVGADDLVVFNGRLSMSSAFSGPANGPKAFDMAVPFAKPFFYNPTNGNLLVDIRNRSGSTVSLVDVAVGGADAMSRAYSVGVSSATAVTRDHGAEVLQLVYSAEPLEPTALSIVVPTIYKETPGNSSSGLFYEPQLRLQEVYAASLFPPNPILIKGIRFRPKGSSFDTTVPNFKVRLSTTTNQPNLLSATFASNLGTDATTVFEGNAKISSSFSDGTNGTKQFDIEIPFEHPFFYDPSMGNLLFDFVNASGLAGSGLAVDAGAGSGSASRIFSGQINAAVAGAADGITDIIEVIYLSEPLEPTAPSILVQPVGSTNNVGAETSLTVGAYGSSPLSYQWLHDGTNVVGGTNSALALPNLRPSDAGAYSVAVSNNLGSVTSSNATITVIALPPSIVTQPVGSTNNVGAEASLTVVANGSPPLNYRWLHEGTNVVGGTNSTLLLSNLQASDAGAYSVVITNFAGSVIGGVAKVVVAIPSNLQTVILPASAATVDAGAAGGSGVLTVALRQQIVVGAVNMPNVPVWIYELRFRPSAVFGKAFSGVIPDIQFNLSTTASDPELLQSTFADNVGADDLVVFNGRLSMSSAFSGPANGPKAFDMAVPFAKPFFYNPTNGNLLVDIRNRSGSTVSLVDVAVGGADAMSRAYSVGVSSATAVTRDHGAEVLQLVYSAEPLEPMAPSILVQPVGSTNNVGAETSLTVVAYGSSPLNYQWIHQGTNVVGGTNSTLALPNLRPSDAGAYWVAVSNNLGSVTSSNATITVIALPPSIVTHPASQTTIVGNTAFFSVVADGARPLAYQWFLNATNTVVAGTNSTLSVTNVGPDEMGDYTVVVANYLGAATSAVAKLSVSYPPAQISIAGTEAYAGSEVSLPVSIRANGNENSLSFSLTYQTSRLQYAGVSLGTGTAEGTVLVNQTQTNSGRVGFAIALPLDTSFNHGTQQVVVVRFNSILATTGSAISTAVGFTTSPIEERLTDMGAATLPRSFSLQATVRLLPSPIEGDVYPRPNGNKILEINDWMQAGRFVAGLEVAASTEEFQRIDTAPRITRGDGKLKVTDWVQVGRYAIGLDPLTGIGGPTSLVSQASAPLNSRSSVAQSAIRTLKAMNASAVQGLSVQIPIVLDAQGNENAVGFSVGFDPAAFEYVSVTKGNAFGAGASMQVNAHETAAGHAGVIIALPTGNTLPAGQATVATLTLRVKTSEPGNYAVTFVDSPLSIGLSDAEANQLEAMPVASTVAIYPAPTLTAIKFGETLKLTWATSAEGFGLQGGGLSGGGWTNVTASPATNGGVIEVILPLTGEPAFFRLRNP
jgi:hypothetical protein